MPKILLLADFSEEYFKKILLGTARYAKENGQWIFCRMPYHYRESLGFNGIISWAKKWGADGMIAQLNNEDDSEQLEKTGFPIIVTDYKERFKHALNITGNYFETGKIGADYFIQKGYQNFAYYGYPSFVWSRERGEGFKEQLIKKGYQASFFEGKTDIQHEMWYYQPSALSEWLLKLPKPIAVMACDDNCGQQITEACKLMNIKIPEELSVLGVDNDELICKLSDPPLSSIALNAEQGGYEAAKIMDEMIQHNKRYGDIKVLPLKIITRQSTDIYATADSEIAKSLKFIHQNFQNTITIDNVLEQLALSRRVFEIRFKKTTGLPIYQYILKLRMDKFEQELIETDRSIADIAFNLGMNDLKNCSRQFKQLKGSSPVQFRKMNKQKN